MTKITITRATVEQALEALDKLYLPGELERVNAAITALRQALEQPNEFHPDWDQIKPFNDRIAELEKVAKQALEALEVATTPLAKDRQEVLRAQAALRRSLQNTPSSGESHEDSWKSCDEALLRQALEALLWGDTNVHAERREQAIAALRERLNQSTN